jgi:ubiquinone/menaquinone biosynthesis C-methylase UbiE
MTTGAVNGVLWGSRARDWADIQEGTVAPVYDAVFSAAQVGAGTRYGDMGCGAGLAAMKAAALGATVSGLDASAALLAIARERTPSGDFHLGELESLPFEDGAFDLTTGFNSFQYAADPIAALREAKRVTRPGGTVVVVTWGEPAGMAAASIVGALKPLLPPAPPQAPGPFALSSREAITAFAEQAGLKVARILDVDCPWHYRDLDTALRGLDASGVAERARAQSGAEAVTAAHSAALEPFRMEDGSYTIGAWFRCLIAEA